MLSILKVAQQSASDSTGDSPCTFSLVLDELVCFVVWLWVVMFHEIGCRYSLVDFGLAQTFSENKRSSQHIATPALPNTKRSQHPQMVPRTPGSGRVPLSPKQAKSLETTGVGVSSWLICFHCVILTTNIRVVGQGSGLQGLESHCCLLPQNACISPKTPKLATEKGKESPAHWDQKTSYGNAAEKTELAASRSDRNKENPSDSTLTSPAPTSLSKLAKKSPRRQLLIKRTGGG